MNTELKEKMQKAAENYVAGKWWKTTPVQEKRIETAVILGAKAMYSELATLVEWVSVEDRMPETGKIVLLKNDLEDISTGCFTSKIFKIDFDEISSKKITHWRRIEL